MSYAKRITEKKYEWGGTVFATPFPAGGSVSVVGSVLGGARFCGSSQLAHIHADMLLEGTASYTKKQLQILLDEIGASLQFYSTDDRLAFAGRTPAKHADKFFALISTVLREPLFPEEGLVLYKQRSEAALSLEAQDTTRQANIALARTLFPVGHPNHAESTQEARAALLDITSQSLRDLHARMISRSTLVVSVAGNLPATRVVSMVQKYFKTLPEQSIGLPKIRKTPARPKARVACFIENKASIDYVLGLRTNITNEHTDFPALLLGLQILGNASGFTGRLMTTVREKEGLTYAVYAYASGFSSMIDGYAMVWGTFAPTLFQKGRSSIMREIKRIVQKGVEEEEVRRHAQQFFSRARVRLSTSGAFARAAHDTAIQGKLLSHLDEFPARVRALTAKQVNRALKKYLTPERFSEAAAGPITKLS